MKLALIVGAAICSVAEPAFAQALHTDVRLTATDAYDDNVLRVDGATPIPNGYTRSDFRFTPGLTFDILRPMGRNSVYLNGSAGYDFYQRSKKLNHERLKMALGGEFHAGDCLQHIEVGYARQQSDLRDFNALLNLRNTEDRKTISLVSSCGGTIGLKPRVSYDHEDVRNSALRRQISDYRSNAFGVSLGYASPALGEVALYGNFRRASYPRRLQIPGATSGDSIDVFSGGLQFTREIGARLKGVVSLGYTKVDPKVATTPSFSGASYSGNLTWTPNDRFRTLIGFSRAVNQSNLLDVSYSIDDSLNIDNTLAMGRSFRARFGGSLVKRRFRDSPLLGPSQRGAGDKFRRVSAGLDYVTRGRIGFGIDLTNAKQSSAVSRFNYHYTTASLSVRFSI